MTRPLLACALALGAVTPVRAQQAPRTLTLGGAARLATELSAPATLARYRAREADGRAREARAALLPSAHASFADGQRTFNTASFGLPLPGFDAHGEIIGPVRTVDVRGRVTATLLDPAARGRLGGARAAAVAADADAASVAEQTAVAAALAYVRALRATAHLAARASDSSLAAGLLRIAQDQLQAGVGVALDVTRASTQLSAVRAQLIVARNEVDRAHLDLLRSVGLPLDAQVALADSLAPLDADQHTTLPSAIEHARRERQDVLAARAALDAARRNARAARAERLPTVGVFGDDGVTSNSYPYLLGTWAWGIQVSVPLFDGFRSGARAEQRDAATRQAEARLHDLEQQAEADVRGAYFDVASSREQLDAAVERLRLAELEVAQARDRFSAGVSGNADVIAAQLGLNGARSLYVDALAAQHTARIALARSQGRVTALP
ncbi:MAG: TolC family protein [Gemmatimonadaceae bacterium]|nr:TolC family protein [Gemmatimonadaceae bacterium]